MLCPILLSESLRSVLHEHQIHELEYQPAYGGESAGLDLYNVGEAITIYPHSHLTHDNNSSKFNTLIPTGLHTAIPKGYVGIIYERGSIIKTPLKIRAGVIDPSYTGEIFINCLNISASPFVIPGRSKLPFQLVIMPAFGFQFVDINTWHEFTANSNRKEGKIGSSDKE